MPTQSQFVVHSPIFPIYSDVKALMTIWKDSTSKSTALDLVNSLWDQTGTPQSPVDWSSPDDWIDSRLTGESKALARHIWEASGKKINPRYVYGPYLFINLYKLLSPDPSGIFRVTEAGQRFLADDPVTVRKIDEAEGVPKLLAILAAHSPAKRGDLLGEWGHYLVANSKYRTPSTIKGTLRHRMLNLVDRGYIERDGNTYTITTKGVAYAADSDRPADQQPYQKVLSAVKTYNDAQVTALRDRLGKMDPYLFESLVKDLLEAMDYEDVIVTKQSGDKGIDVIANYEFGITQIREVVQVKRQQGTIVRPILDQLRGALPYHQAIRGTIITLGKFAQGCKDAALFPGAAPITLIDGDKLIELMLKHEIGIKKIPQALFEVDDSYFTQEPAEALLASADQSIDRDGNDL
jgi:restriction system protein